MTALKEDIAFAIDRLGIRGDQEIRVGDDAAAIPRDGGYDLLACEGMDSRFVRAMPWFAGWSSVMVNLSDIAAMGGTATALVNAVWSSSDETHVGEVLAGMRDACEAYNVPMVGGHTNLRASQTHLSVSVLGRAENLLTSFDAQPGHALVMAINLNGRWHGDQPFWDAATDASPERLRSHLAILPEVAERQLAVAAKDISQAGILGTATMLCETSQVGAVIDLSCIPRPENVSIARWLKLFPSFGFLLATDFDRVDELITLFETNQIDARCIGSFDDSGKVVTRENGTRELFYDLSTHCFTGC
ncbi:MAG: sll0787 family AIR synthase-like protein [Planctomycetota bacterium]